MEHSPTSSSGGFPTSIIEIRSSGGTDSDVLREIKNQLKPLQDSVSGFDFANVVGRYVEGFQAHNDDLMASALRWLRAEYRTKTEARQDLDVRSIIDDVQFYDYLKLFAAFVRLAGLCGSADQHRRDGRFLPPPEQLASPHGQLRSAPPHPE